MARLDWEKARRQEQARRDRTHAAKAGRSAIKRQEALRQFVEKHDLVCFRCGHNDREIAKTGISKQGPWMVCVPCVEEHKQSR